MSQRPPKHDISPHSPSPADELNASKSPPLPFIAIKGVVQRYPWGKKGADSRVGVLSKEAALAPLEPFAELWFGAHRSHPSPVIFRQRSGGSALPAQNLLELLTVREEVCTPSAFHATPLPFLLKVLSVGAPLSIQLHPNKSTAERLHARDPVHYPDSNHKPELAVALTDVELVCGVRAWDKLLPLFEAVPELSCLLIDGYKTLPSKTVVKEIFSKLFALPEAEIKTLIEITLEKAAKLPSLAANVQWANRAKEISSPSDPGLLVILLLEHTTLRPGEAVYIAPGVPHAYLSGDLVECMASSDNVVRAGLTPKFIDVAVFLELLEYDSSSSHRLSPSTDGSTTAQYFTPPVKDFALVRCSKVSGEFLTHATGSAIAFCNDGEIVLNCSETGVTLALCAGDAVYLPTITPSLTYSAVHGDMFIACASN